MPALLQVLGEPGANRSASEIPLPLVSSQFVKIMKKETSESVRTPLCQAYSAFTNLTRRN